MRYDIWVPEKLKVNLADGARATRFDGVVDIFIKSNKVNFF